MHVDSHSSILSHLPNSGARPDPTEGNKRTGRGGDRTPTGEGRGVNEFAISEVPLGPRSGLTSSPSLRFALDTGEVCSVDPMLILLSLLPSATVPVAKPHGGFGVEKACYS